MNAKTTRVILGGALILAGTTAWAQHTETVADARVLIADARAFASSVTTQEGLALLKEIAAARVAMDVEGDLGAVEKTLDALARRALDGKGFEGQTEALVQLALARADLYMRLGQRAEALDAVRVLNRFTFKLGEIVALPPPSLASAQAAEHDPRLVARREQLEREAGQGSDPAASSLKSLIDRYIEHEDWVRITYIGTPAAEYVGQAALDSANVFPGGEDPLTMLVKIDERYAVRFLLEHFDAGGGLWKKRILRALGANSAVSNAGTWTSSDPHVCLEPELLRLLERLLAVPETAVDTLRLLFVVQQNDALTEGLVAALVRGLASDGPEFASAAMQLFEGNDTPSAQPVLEAALALPDVRLRRLAAAKLANFERSEALLARAGDADPEMRKTVAWALGVHEGWLAQQGGAKTKLYWNSPLPARDLPVLRRLLADADENVRAVAVTKLGGLTPPLEAAAYDALLADPSALVRAELVPAWRIPAELRARVLGQLARDASLDVVAKVDKVLEDASKNSDPLARDPRPYLPALEARLKDAERPLDGYLRSRCIHSLIQSDEGLRALVGWVLATGDAGLLDEVCDGTTAELCLTLPDEYLARLLATSNQAADGPWGPTWAALASATPRRGAALRLLFTNANASRTVRLTAAALAADGTSAYRDALLKLLELPTWREQPLDASERNQLADARGRIAKAERNAVALAVVKDAAIPPEIARIFVGDYPLDAPGSRELTQAVLERWFKPEVPPSDAVRQALRHLGSLPELAQPALLERALFQPAYASAAVEAMGALRDPALVPLLGRAMGAEWMPVNGDPGRSEIQVRAAEALAGLASEAAAPFLLEGLKSNDPTLFNVCIEGLDRIEEYDRRARAWRDRAVAPPTKESALAELVTMLADKDPVLRRQAALGLGTLGAVETIPQLIRLLKDADASVVAAAQQALERLNARKDEAPSDG
ncbi:MAG: hypothetical protein EXS08_10515 [Planctomycetes bacterium]|nr:hypothetical protein [Planctomycetota bacterium]